MRETRRDWTMRSTLQEAVHQQQQIDRNRRIVHFSLEELLIQVGMATSFLVDLSEEIARPTGPSWTEKWYPLPIR